MNPTDNANPVRPRLVRRPSRHLSRRRSRPRAEPTLRIPRRRLPRLRRPPGRPPERRCRLARPLRRRRSPARFRGPPAAKFPPRASPWKQPLRLPRIQIHPLVRRAAFAVAATLVVGTCGYFASRTLNPSAKPVHSKIAQTGAASQLYQHDFQYLAADSPILDVRLLSRKSAR